MRNVIRLRARFLATRPSGLAFAAVALVASVGCQVSPDEHVGVDRAAITHGVDVSLDRATGVLRLPGTEPIAFQCTATLIGRRTVLTAGQCALHLAKVEFCDYPCGNVFNCSPTCVSGTMHDYPTYHPPNDPEDDLAVVLLDDDFTTRTGIFPVRLGGPPSEGDVITIEGYGCSNQFMKDGLGQKRGGINNVSGVDDQIIEFDDQSQAYYCSGDYGGPMMLPGTDCEVAVNVATDPGAFGPTFKATRVDTKLGFIRSTANDPSVNNCGQTTCGDGLCMSPEYCATCPQDCGVCGVCGDGVCSTNETCVSCPGDCGTCAYCGDGVCNNGEDFGSCPEDCPVECPAGKVDCCLDGRCLPRSTCQHVVCGG